jgi:hypothetical protein
MRLLLARKIASASAPKRALISAAFGALLGALALTVSAEAADFGVIAGGVRPDIEVSTLRERKFERVVRQKFDFSCGSAALATLLTQHYGRPTAETDAFRKMWAVGDQARIKEVGFSLLEMQRYLKDAGLKADGFKLTLDRVAEVGVPGIALIDVKGYKHFVVIKGVDDRRVLIGDPSAGVYSRSRKDFEKQWDGVILYIRSDVQQGKASFNMAADWDLAPGGPGRRAMDRQTLQSQHLELTRPAFSGFAIGATGLN